MIKVVRLDSALKTDDAARQLVVDNITLIVNEIKGYSGKGINLLVDVDSENVSNLEEVDGVYLVEDLAKYKLMQQNLG